MSPTYARKCNALRILKIAIPYRRISILCVAVLAAFTVSLFTTTDVSAADIIHVKPAQSGSGDGGSWLNAATLQDALQNLADAGDEIWVAKGVYTPGLSPTDTFSLTPGVAVYGGFAGTESERSQRDWETNVTVLSGDIGGDDIVDANGVVTDTANIVGVNSYHVVSADGTTTPITGDSILDGFHSYGWIC